MEIHAPSAQAHAGKYLTFRVGRQYFAMEATCVRGILPMRALVRFSVTWQFVHGIAALGGQDFPVIDLKARLNLQDCSPGRAPCIVVVETRGEMGARLLGFVADRVSEVANCRPRDLRGGFLRNGGRPRRVLDPGQILTESELLSLWPC